MNLSLNMASAWAGSSVDTSFGNAEEAMLAGDNGDGAASDQSFSRSQARPPLASPRLPKLIPSVLERSARAVLVPLTFMGTVACGSEWKAIDIDGDGYSIAQGDCWDNPETSPGIGIQSTEVHPGATDVACDAVDQDCDGVDKGLIRYDDIDGDSYGDSNNLVESCEKPVGTVTNADDCKDNDAAINPSASEVCDGVDQNCNGEIDEDATDMQEWYTDADGDGYGATSSPQVACEAPVEGDVTNSNDCDDTLADVHPYATETCNTVDDNCDGEIDEDLALNSFYTDADADGYGDANAEILDCSETVLDGTVTNANDCDDTSVDVHPYATETCNGIDDDCDESIDNDALDALTWYGDADSDSYGDVTSVTAACDQPFGFVYDASDCDDADALVNPVAGEICDAIDNNCDGIVDDDAVDKSTWYADADADGYGDVAATALACDSPLAYVSNASDCDDTNANTYSGASDVFDGAVNDCDATATAEGPFDITSGYPRLVGEQAGDALSYTAHLLPYVGDINDDGSGDFLVSASETTRSTLSSSGITYAISVDALAGFSGDNDIGSIAFATWTGDEVNARIGSTLSAAGDTDGDGNPDFVIGAPFIVNGTGEAYLIRGSAGLSGAYAPSDAAVILSGDGESEYFGKAFAYADFDGDGLDDLVVTSTSTSLPERVNFFDAGTLASASALTRSDADLTLAGSSLAVDDPIGLDAQDMDGDGYPDLVVGCTENDDAATQAGKVYAVFNPDSLVDQAISTAASLTLLGNAIGDTLGYGTTLINDLPDDGDGLPEIGSGAYLSDNVSTDDGSFSIFYSGSTGTTGSFTLGDADVTFIGDSAGAGFGVSSHVADATGDDIDDFLIGTHYDNSVTFFDGSLLSAGTYYTSMTNSAFTTFNGSDDTGDSVGLIPASAGTGYALIGSYGYDAATGTDAGSVTVVERR